MSDRTPSFDELNDLLDKLAAGPLVESEHARLSELVDGDLAARRHYIDRMFLIAELRCRLAPQTVPALAAAPQQAAPQFVAPTARRTARHYPYIPSFIRRHPLAWSITGSGALFTAYIVFLTWGMLDTRNQARGPRLAASGSEQQVATITGSQDAKWQLDKSEVRRLKAGGSDRQAENRNQKSEIQLAEPLQLASGIVELQLKQGVTLIVEGPAEWSIDGINAATLLRGKLVATVPQGAVGFTVETPTIKIIDLGTEFGVEVTGNGTAQVQVVRGMIDVQSTNGSSASPPRRLSAGQGAYVDSTGSLFIEESTPSSKLTRLIQVSRSRRDATATNVDQAEPKSYFEAVLNDRPVAYWPLDEKANATTVRDASGHGHDGTLSGGVTLQVSGPLPKTNRTAARFDGMGSIRINRPGPLNQPNTITLEAWIRPRPTANGKMRIFSLETGGARVNAAGFGAGVWTSDTRCYPMLTQYSIRHHPFNAPSIPVDRWYHFAIVCDPHSNFHVFLNGKERAKLKNNTPIRTLASLAVIGGLSNGREAWAGDLAHVAIYHRALEWFHLEGHLKAAQAATISE